jgi:hypothetical protein
MSCDELLHRRASRVNKGGTPTVTLGISTVVAILFIVSATFSQILAALAFFFVANYSMVISQSSFCGFVNRTCHGPIAPGVIPGPLY